MPLSPRWPCSTSRRAISRTGRCSWRHRVDALLRDCAPTGVPLRRSRGSRQPGPSRARGRLVAGLLVGMACLVTPPSISAQSSGVRLSAASGVAFDSVRGRPLVAALVVVPSLGLSAITDSGGRFEIRDVPDGRHEIVLQHEFLDSLGMPEPRSTFVAPERSTGILLAIPSAGTLWRRLCGRPTPKDSGFVHGTVRSARAREPIAGAQVRVSWLEVRYDRRAGIAQAWMGGQVRTDGEGRYLICGVPIAVQLQLLATSEASGSDVVATLENAPGITRRDFYLSSAAESAFVGTVRGVITSAAGSAVANALVTAHGGREVRSDSSGRFILSSVPIGTRMLMVRSIGVAPVAVIADVIWRDTTTLHIALNSITLLNSVEIVGSLVLRRFVTDLEERKALGIAKFVDSTRARRLGNIHSALAASSNARIDRNGRISFGGECAPILWIDKEYVRREDVVTELRLLDVNRVGMIEVYERRTAIPPEFWPRDGGMPSCAIVIWTNRSFP